LYPLLTIDLDKIEHNSKLLVKRCNARGIDIVGVTKCCLGSVPIAKAICAGGVGSIGDSRLKNLRKLNRAGISPLIMLRQPMKHEVAEVIKIVDVSLISEIDAAVSLAQSAVASQKEHSIILMVEVGDLREGILPTDLPDVVEKILDIPALNLLGIGVNVACLEGESPSTETLNFLCQLAKEIEQELNLDISIISGGNSSALRLLEFGQIPEEINQLRIGEGILLGQETSEYKSIEGLYQDAFVLTAEIIEVREKRVRPGALEKRAVLALGKQDIADGKVKPLINGIEVLEISSDHLVVGLDNCSKKMQVSNSVAFIPSYFALLAAMTSPFVNKKFCEV